MSPANFLNLAPAAVDHALARAWAGFGIELRETRQARRWTTQYLARRAGLSRSLVYLAERGERISLEAAAGLATALGLRIEIDLVDPHKPQVHSIRQADPVHSAMGELEAGNLRRLGFRVALMSRTSTISLRAAPMSWPGTPTHAPCSTSRIGRGSPTCRRWPGHTTPSGLTLAG